MYLVIRSVFFCCIKIYEDLQNLDDIARNCLTDLANL